MREAKKVISGTTFMDFTTMEDLKKVCGFFYLSHKKIKAF